MPSAGFEPAIPASERPQTHALDRAAIVNSKHDTLTAYSTEGNAHRDNRVLVDKQLHKLNNMLKILTVTSCLVMFLNTDQHARVNVTRLYGLRRTSAAAGIPGLRVRNRLRAQVFVFCECCVSSGTGLCVVF
jgi:hypothetical protein